MPQVELFLLFYWIMTAFHGLHVTIGVVAVLIVAASVWKRDFTGTYYAPVDVLAVCTGTSSISCGFSYCPCCTCWARII